jgi:hypothetical protein
VWHGDRVILSPECLFSLPRIFYNLWSVMQCRLPNWTNLWSEDHAPTSQLSNICWCRPCHHESQPETVNHPKGLLDSYVVASGLPVNFHKSFLVPIIVRNAQIQIFTDILQCQLGVFPFKYLGLPFNLTKPRIEHFLPLIQRGQQRVSVCADYKWLMVSSRLWQLMSWVASNFTKELWMNMTNTEDTVSGGGRVWKRKPHPWLLGS